MDTDDDSIIRCSGLVKRFGKFTAVDGIDLDIKEGEIYGFLGPNGAGKTTTVRMLTTIDVPDEGQVWIGGHDTHSDFIEARKLLGIIQQQHSLDKDLTVKENIIHHALMENLSWKESHRRMNELADQMELHEFMNKKVMHLSGGWKKRVAIVCSLIHTPKVLFMDEPTTGLDTQSRNMLWKLIRNINRTGTTIFLTTHYIFEAESLCDRIGIINKGKIIAEGTPKELKEKVGKFTLVSVDPEGNENTSYFQDLAHAKNASLDVPPDCSISIRRTNLEDVFLELTGRRM